MVCTQRFFIKLLLAVCCALNLFADKNSTAVNKSADQMVLFEYKDTPLADVLSALAKEKKLNVIMPQGDGAIASKVTLGFGEKIPLAQAWSYLTMILDMAGYTLIQESNFVSVFKTDKGAPAKEVLPFYVNVPYQDLPASDEYIWYFHSFKNIQVDSNVLQEILVGLLSKTPEAKFVFESTLNAVLILDRSECIRAAIEIIDALDSKEFSEAVDVLVLHYVAADTVVDLFGKLAPANKGAPKLASAGDSYFFSPNVRMLPEPRTNKLILSGPRDAIGRVRDFIISYIDVPMDSGESLLHIYPLQYLEASVCKDVLNAIINSAAASAQSSSTQKPSAEQFFKGVKIECETSGGSNSMSANTSTNLRSIGNKLLVAAQKDDWVRLKQLIQQIDRPNLQVAIEVLIVDLNTDYNRSLATQLRDKKSWDIKDTHFQTSNMGHLVLNSNDPTTPDALMANLLRMTTVDGSAGNFATRSAAGTFMISFADTDTPAVTGGTVPPAGMWLLVSMLKSFSNATILSQPFMVATNNTKTILRH